jgi:hypothetical protein
MYGGGLTAAAAFPDHVKSGARGAAPGFGSYPRPQAWRHLVMANLYSHKGPKVRRMIEAAGAS